MIREKKRKILQIRELGQQKQSTDNNKQQQRNTIDGTAIFLVDSILNGIIQKRLSRKGRVVKVHNFRGAMIDNMKHHVIP